MDAPVADAILSLQPSSILDVGAGSGQYGLYFASVAPSVRYSAVDGALNVERFTDGRVRWADLSLPLLLDGPSEWVMSLEVGEHLPQEFESQFFDTLDAWNTRGVVLSWAVVGQPGAGHVNCRDNPYVVSKMEGLGYWLDENVTALGRSAPQNWWFKNTFMVFRRRTK